MVAKKDATCGWCGKVFSAQDANGDINPADVQAAITSFEDAINEAQKSINTALVQVEPDVKNAIRSYKKDLTGKLNEISEAANDMGEACRQVTEGLYAKAVAKHDELQNGYNDQAQAGANACYEADKARAEAEAAAAAAAAAKGN